MNTVMAQRRDPAAKAKQLRRSGIVPCVIYGVEMPQSLSIQIAQSTAVQLRRTMRSGSKVNVQIDETIYPALIKELETDIRGNVVHISFNILDPGKKFNSVADIVLLNRDKVSGILEQMQMRIPHAALPQYLLDVVTVDLEKIPVGTTLTIGDIPEFCSKNIELQADPGNIVLRVIDKKRFDVLREPTAKADTATPAE